MFGSVGKVARSACAPVREARGKGQRGLPPGFVWLFGLVGVIPVPLDPASRAAVVAPWPAKKKVFDAAFSNFFTAPGRTSRAGDQGPVRANISAKHRNPGGHVKPPARIVLDLGERFFETALVRAVGSDEID